MGLNIIQKVKNPMVLIITPLLTGHTILKECKKSVKRNDIEFDWVSHEGDGEAPENLQSAIDGYKDKYKVLPPYTFVLARDIICGRHMIDRLHNKLKDTPDNIGFSYCPFEFKGHLNMKVPPIEYNINKLIVKNYISGVSLYKSNVLEKVHGFTAEKFLHRLNDWAMFIRLYREGYSGILCKDTYFIAISSENDISSGSDEEYAMSYNHVVDNYIRGIKL